MTMQEKNAALKVLDSLFFAYFQADAETRLREAIGGEPTEADLNALRDYCIDGLHEYVEGKIEKYLDDKAQEAAELAEQESGYRHGCGF